LNLVSGATGFLGAHLVCTLLHHGEAVRACKRVSSSLKEFNFIFEHYFTSALVQTEKTYCLIAAAIGTVILHGHKIAIISEISPLAKLLIGKTVDQQIKLGQQETKIVAFI